MRALASAAREAERDARRRQRALLEQQRVVAKETALRVAAHEADLYEASIDALTSVHKECGKVWNWQDIKDTPIPRKPDRVQDAEVDALLRLQRYEPSLLDRLFRRVQVRRGRLEVAVELAKERDKEQNTKRLNQYEQDVADCEKARAFATAILNGDLDAYKQAVEESRALSEIEELGSAVSVSAKNSSCIESTFQVRGTSVVPSEIKTLTQSGKLSVKKMPKGQFLELYEDYVCACVLRIGREIFALLPVDMIFVTATDDLLDTATGYKSVKPILSVALTRREMSKLNFDAVDPSDAMSNFVHNMKFSKSAGFNAVERLATNFQPVKAG